MSKAEETKAFIIEKVAPLFNKQGYAGTSLSDMTTVTGLTKGSIYGNFANKDEVALAVFRYNTQLLNTNLKRAVSNKENAKAKLVGFIEYYRTDWKKIFEKGGCPIQNAAIEADDNLPFLKNAVQASIKNWVKFIVNLLDEGKATGEFHKNISSLDYAYTFIALLEGGLMLAKITHNQQHLFTSIDRILLIIEQEITS